MGLHQKLIERFTYPLSLARAGERRQLAYLAEFEASQYLPSEELYTLQSRRLRQLLAHAYENCPFYRDRFRAAGLAPDDVRRPDDLRAVPVLEKADIQENRDRMIAANWPAADLIRNQTGGSTGRPISFYLSKDRKMSRAAATLRHNRWAGWQIGDKVALIWGAPRDVPTGGWRARLRNLLVERQLYLDTAHLSEAKLASFHSALGRFRPKVVLAYARSAVLFARFLQERGLRPYRPGALVTSAEVLEAADRRLLEGVFGCPVFNRYGCREVSVLASECAEHRGLHTMAEGLYIEVVGDPAAEQLPAEEVGSILVTDLLNLAMPLIRYRIGDVGAWEAGACPCGRGLPRLRSVAGRVTDFVVGTDGRLVSGVFLATYVLAQRPSLGQVQLCQSEARKVRYRIKPGPGFHAADLEYLCRTSRQYLGDDMTVEHELLDKEIAPEQSGKFLLSRCSLPLFARPAGSGVALTSPAAEN
jgi:phenylacetate-CoA ligase